MAVVTPGEVERCLRKLLGKQMTEQPGEPPLDRRDIYLHLVKVFRIYPELGLALVKPFDQLYSQHYDPKPVRLSYPFFDNQSLLTCVPAGEEGVDRRGRYIVPRADVWAVSLAIEGVSDRKGEYILGFVKRDDQLISERGTVEETGWIIEYGNARIEIGKRPGESDVSVRVRCGGSQLTLDNDTITLDAKKIVINADHFVKNDSL